MDVKKWDAFLSDPELKNNQNYRNRHNGKYLFGKILHDTLECLNNYKGIYSLAISKEVSEKVKISPASLRWFTQKVQVIEFTVTEITPMWDFYKKLPTLSDEWPKLIEVVGSKLRNISTFANDDEVLNQSVQGMERDFLTMAISNLRGAKAIYEDIQVENYNRLLVTQKYQNLDS